MAEINLLKLMKEKIKKFVVENWFRIINKERKKNNYEN